jgi:hypothetical protein
MQRMKLPEFVRHWAKREEAALRAQFHGKAPARRLLGLQRSERNKARLFLLALLPLGIVGPVVGKWSEASSLGKAIMALGLVWAVSVIGLGSFLFLRAIVRAARKPRE